MLHMVLPVKVTNEALMVVDNALRNQALQRLHRFHIYSSCQDLGELLLRGPKKSGCPASHKQWQAAQGPHQLAAPQIILTILGPHLLAVPRTL